MIGKAFNVALHETAPVYAICGSELQIEYKGKLIWVRRVDWPLIA